MYKMGMENPIEETLILTASVHAIEPDEQVLEEARASLNDLKTMLPAGIDPEANPDLLICCANIAVAGIVNRNDDGMDRLTALECYSKFKHKFIDFEHSRKQVVGFILHAGLSEIGTNRVISEEEARKSEQPFNIALVFVVWKAINGDLADDIVAASNPAHSDFNSISLSFEMAFKGCYIAVIPDGEILISRATKLITPDQPDFPKWKKTLRAYKGSGRSLEGDGHTYRILPYNVIPLGGGIVENPAAPVKGITVITEATAPQITVPQTAAPTTAECDDEDEEHEMDDANYMAATQVRFNNFYERAVKALEIGVSPVTTTFITNSTMDPKQIQAYKDKVVKADKLEDFKEVALASTTVIEAIIAESEKRELDKKAAELRATEIERVKTEAEAARDQAMKDLTSTKTEMASIKQELDQIKAAQQAETLARKFDERMNLISDTFEFSDDERVEVAADVKGLDDEAFAKYFEKSKKMMKEKTKEFKKMKKDEECKAREQLLASLKAKGVTIELKDSLNTEEIIAAAMANPISAPAGSNLEPAKNLNDRAKAAFANVTMGGKKFSDLEETK